MSSFHTDPIPTFPGEGSSSLMLAAAHPKKKAGRKKFRETRHPVYRGIRQRNSGRWVCELRFPANWKTRLWLGTFQTAEMAARAHDVAAIAIRGPSACLNFADSAWRLPVPASADPKDIQRVAVEAAEAFHPSKAPQLATQPSEGPVSSGTTVPADKLPPQSYSFDNVFLMDDDHTMWNPEVLSDMYKGMMLPPPPELNHHGLVYDDDVSDFDLPLWSFSI